MIYHLFYQSHFINDFIDILLSIDPLHINNKFIYIGDGAINNFDENIKYIEFKPFGTVVFNKFINKLSSDDEIIFHGLTLPLMRWISRTKNANFTISWVFFGSQYYYFLDSTKDNFKLYDDITHKYVKKCLYLPPLLRLIYWPYIKLWKHGLRRYLLVHYFKTCIVKINTLYFYNFYEYQLMKDSFNKNLIYKHFFYPRFAKNLDKIKVTNSGIDKPQIKKFRTYNILLGNSGDITNNYYDLIEHLEYDSNIIYYLSFGYGHSLITKDIENKFQMKFDNNFEIINKFMSYDDFATIVKSMDLGIMFHNRPQGFGLILLLLYFNIPLLIKETNLLTKYLDLIGAKYISVNSTNLMYSINNSIYNKSLYINRDIIIKHFNIEAVRQMYLNLFM